MNLHTCGNESSFFYLQYLKERFKIDVPHRFKKYTFLGPTFCDMCGQLMHGIFRQQLKCEGELLTLVYSWAKYNKYLQ